MADSHIAWYSNKLWSGLLVASIMLHTDGINFSDIRLKQKDQVRTWSDVTNMACTGGCHQHQSNCSFQLLTCHNAAFTRHGSDIFVTSCQHSRQHCLSTVTCLRITACKRNLHEQETLLETQVSVPVIDGGYLCVMTWSEDKGMKDIVYKKLQAWAD